MIKDIEKYKDYPEGSGGKRLYDKYHMEFELWVNKYYENPNLLGWDEFSKWANEAFKKSRDFEMIWCKNRSNPYNFEKLHSTFDNLKTLNLLNDDLNKFIAFMAGEGFFEKYEISTYEWLNSKKWKSPDVDCSENCYSIFEILTLKNGLNYVKVSLAELNFWKFL